jgi:glyoxylase-like metal-dependent hydrolase (beta-lactamase superfamily II)
MGVEKVSRSVQTFETGKGNLIFQIPLKAFPIIWGYAYLVWLRMEAEESWVLIDTGSGYGDSNRHLEEGFQAVSEVVGRTVSFSDLKYILMTHGHIDHIGGLPHILPQTGAKLGIHELDRRNLTNYEERLIIVARRLEEFLIEAGLQDAQRDHLLSMYHLTKSLFRSVKVDFTYEEQGMQIGSFELLHVPGHCAGHVVIRLDDVLFTGDHVLDDTSPHQAPERLTLSTGLSHYLHSLDALLSWSGNARLFLGGHKAPIHDLQGRVREIKKVHQLRLSEVCDLLQQPRTIADIAEILFGEVHGYNELLAVEEAGAHVEYLYQRGILEIDNLQDVENARGPTPIYYRCIKGHQDGDRLNNHQHRQNQ